MYGYIYEIINLINNKRYIGKHKSNSFDKNYYGSGVSFKKDLNKYGKDNFKVIILEEIYTNQEDLDNAEIRWIEATNAVRSNKYYNNSYGGENEGWAGVNRAAKENGYSLETREKLSLSHKGQIPWNKGKKCKALSKEHKESISKALKNRQFSEETKNKMSKAAKNRAKNYNFIPWNKNKSLSEETKNKISNTLKRKYALNEIIITEEQRYKHGSANRNKVRSDETKKKISKANKGRIVSEETRNKISNSLKGKNNPMYNKTPWNKGKISVNRGKIWVNNLIVSKLILPDDLDKYLQDGWFKGRSTQKY